MASLGEGGGEVFMCGLSCIFSTYGGFIAVVTVSFIFGGDYFWKEIEYKSSCSLSIYLLASVVALGGSQGGAYWCWKSYATCASEIQFNLVSFENSIP